MSSVEEKLSFTESDTSEQDSNPPRYVDNDNDVHHDDDETPIGDSGGGTSAVSPKSLAISSNLDSHSMFPPGTDMSTFSSRLRYVPRCLRFEREPLEATGIAIDFYARGPILMASMVLGPALLALASKEAGCNRDGTGCSKVYGFRPSSLLSNLAIVTGLLISIAMPFFGAIVDYTPYRRQIAAGSAAALSCIKMAEVMVGPNTWFTVTILQVFSALLYNAHATAAYAYTSELSASTRKQARFNSFFNVVLYVSMLFFLVQVMALSHMLGVTDIGMAKVSQTITGLTSALCFYYAWKNLFHDRPALSQVPAGESLWTCGFRKVFHSGKRIHEQHKVLRAVILSLTFAEAGLSAISTVATTYLAQVLGMNSSEIVLVFFLCLLFGAPGSALGGQVASRFGAVTSALICHFGLIVVTGAASIFLTNASHKPWAYMFASLWGIFTGWLPPMNVTMFISVMPADSRAEFMGIYMLSTSILSWLPPLVFTALNERGIYMGFGLASLVIFFFIGVVFLLSMGRENYKNAVLEAELNNANNCVDYARQGNQEMIQDPAGLTHRDEDVDESSCEVHELL